MAINLNNMSDIEIMAINKMHLEDKIKKLEEELSELKQQQLYKEYFKKIANTSFSSKGHTSFTTWELKDNSKYDKLPSKEDK